MDVQNLLSIVFILISTVLSVGAIVLSFWFYKESTKQNKETALMQSDIKNAIEKVEQLYNRTYTRANSL
jgi:flagellar basal body-associated protein FliL